MNSLSPSFVSKSALDTWYALYAGKRELAQKHYFEAVLPGVVEYLQGLPEHRELARQRCSTLISLMGFSPETTVLATALLRPQRVLVLHSEATPESVNLAAKFLTSRDIVSFKGIDAVSVDSTSPVDLYEKIAGQLVGRHGERNIIDVTGGKKVMSAMAAIVAAELDIQMCYINGAYDAQLRRPTPGTERLMLLSAHGRLSAMHQRERALDRYEAYDYPAAIAAFQSSREAQLHGAHLEDFALALCQVYAAWVDLDRKTLAQKLDAFELMAARKNQLRLCSGIPHLAAQLAALRSVATGEGASMLATFIELAYRCAARGRHDFACLLAYRSMEAVLQLGMHRASGGQFDFSAPRYELLGDPSAVERRFVELSGSIGTRALERLPTRVGMVEGLLLLGVADDTVLRRIGQRQLKSLAGWVRAVAEKRNQSVLAHGMQNLDAEDFHSMIELVDRLTQAVLGEDHARVDELRTQLQPCDLRHFVFASARHSDG